MIFTLIVFIFVLAVLVLAHEFGHFIVARKNGIKVEEFGFGFPPRLFGVRRGDTLYSLNLIPLGGFVKIKGEDGENAVDSDSFSAKKIWQRVLVLSAGVIMNFVLAAVLLGAGFIIGLPQSVEDAGRGAKISNPKIEIMAVLPGAPAQSAGLSLGDEIVSVDGRVMSDLADLQNYVDTNQGKSLNFVLRRNNEIFGKEITPVEIKESGRGGIGVALMNIGTISYPWYLAVPKGFAAAGYFGVEVLRAFGGLFKDLIVGAPSVTENLAGPVGIAVLTGKAAKLGIGYLLQFMAMLSVNLAILNILPIPALDGGRILFLIIEKLRGRPVGRRLENAFHTTGFALLMLLVLAVTAKDVSHLKGFFFSIWQKLF